MVKPQKPAYRQRFHLVTVEYGSGKLLHMWTSLLYMEGSDHNTEINEAALLRFRCFTRKLFQDVDVRSVKSLKVSEVKIVPGRIRSKKFTVTDVLNYRDRSIPAPESGTVYVWGKSSKKQFVMINNPLAVNSESNPEFFPKF